MIRGVAFVPGSPLLVPGLGGQADVLADLRVTARRAVAALGPGPLVVLGEGEPGTGYDLDEPYRGWGPGHGPAPTGGGHRGAGRPLPPALAVGVSLLPRPADAVMAVQDATDRPDLPDGAGLVVVGDGSARRGPLAPLPADPRAERFDRDLAAALGSGSAARLLAVDGGLGAELGARLAAWRLAALLAGPRLWQAQVLAEQAPLGVAYLVATWA